MSPAASAERYRTIRVSLLEEGTLLRLLLDRPKGNVLTSEMMAELAAALEEHEARPELRLVVLRGAGGTFSYGASVEEHRKDQAPGMLAAFHRLIRRLAAYPVPVAALIEGHCLGGGFELTLPCHFLFATPEAKLGCPEIKLGVFPPVLAAIGAWRMGASAAERILLTGRPMDSAEAWRLGLVTEVFDVEGDPEEALLAWYRESLLPLSAFALRQGTRALRRASGFLDQLDRALAAAETQYVDEVLPSHDGNEGVEAFLARRPAEWRNR
jgi:cyclohexa-1,5-dienecarbonyl-CoA hydratase